MLFLMKTGNLLKEKPFWSFLQNNFFQIILWKESFELSGLSNFCNFEEVCEMELIPACTVFNLGNHYSAYLHNILSKIVSSWAISIDNICCNKLTGQTLMKTMIKKFCVANSLLRGRKGILLWFFLTKWMIKASFFPFVKEHYSKWNRR